MYFGLMKKYKEQYGVKIYAYNLMPSHLHLLMEVDEKTTISTLMHNLNSIYTKYYNGRYERKGHLFRERFKAALIENDPKVLLNLTAYMHISAKKMEAAIKGLTRPCNSYSLYLDYEQQDDHGLDIKNEISTILSGLVDENYSQYIQKAEQNIEFKKMHKQLQRKGILGSHAFMEEVSNKIGELRDSELAKKETVKPKKQAVKAAEPKKVKIFNSSGIALLIAVLSAAGIYFNFDYSKNVDQLKVSQKEEKAIETDIKVQTVNLDDTEWELILSDSSGKENKTDIIYFNNGKVISADLSRSNYPKANYSQVADGDKIIWQTMQTSNSGTASWRGEVRDNKMNGMLSLRQKGKQTEVFSFKSDKFRKKIGGKR